MTVLPITAQKGQVLRVSESPWLIRTISHHLLVHAQPTHREGLRVFALFGVGARRAVMTAPRAFPEVGDALTPVYILAQLPAFHDAQHGWPRAW